LTNYNHTLTISSMKLKPVYRSTKNKLFTGVAGGLGEATGIPPIVFRAGFAISFLSIKWAPYSIISYLVLFFIMPENSIKTVNHNSDSLFKKFWGNSKDSRVVDATEVEVKTKKVDE
jgi:phage shock protein PspC (stress-responsive transcriptional regulator)